MVIYAGVEGGGTSWRVALAEGHPTNIVDSKSFVTKYDAREQLKEIKDWLSEREYDALGIGTFGPIDPREVTAAKPGTPGRLFYVFLVCHASCLRRSISCLRWSPLYCRRICTTCIMYLSGFVDITITTLGTIICNSK